MDARMIADDYFDRLRRRLDDVDDCIMYYTRFTRSTNLRPGKHCDQTNNAEQSTDRWAGAAMQTTAKSFLS